MEDIAVSGIILKSIKYKEKDVLVHIFSLELGNITAILKGALSTNAKFKFATQTFCFAKFDLAKSHEFYVVKSVELINTFFELTLDYDTYSYALSILEVCDHILKPGILAEGLFISLIKTLQNIVYNNIDYKLAVLKFYIEMLAILGYGLNFIKCDNCGMKFVGDIKFNFETGTFRCFNCSGGEKLSVRDFTTLKLINNVDIDRLNSLKIKSEYLNYPLKLIFQNLQDKIGYKVKSVNL